MMLENTVIPITKIKLNIYCSLTDVNLLATVKIGLLLHLHIFDWLLIVLVCFICY